MDTFIQVVVSGLTLGAMYAASTIGLSLVWGAMGVLNMAHGALLTIGGYASYSAVISLGLPWFLGLPAAMVVSFVVGLAIYHVIFRFMYRRPAFEVNVIIATVGLALFFEQLVLLIYGAYPFLQPFKIAEGFYVSRVHIPYQNVLILVMAVAVMLVIAWLLAKTRIGRAIRATALDRDAAQLMGVAVGRVFAQVMGIAGVVAAISGVMLSSITTLSPTMGYDPMLKAFIICVIAGLGNVPGSLIAAFALGLIEAAVQFVFGVRFGFPALLFLVIVALIWRPYGIFGRKVVRRV
jgi:branched-chain amino acid transport system permease protein